MTPILIVDDSLTVRMDLAEAFAAGGLEPVLVGDLASAREALAGRTFALVVLDLLLPDGDGLDLLGEIRRSPRHGATPVVLLSSEAEVRHRVRGLSTGADDYVGKPYDPAQVVARARRLVRSREAQQDPGVRSRPVLVIDDSVTTREELRATLEGAGLEVLTASSGEDGLRLAADGRPAAVIVDAGLPGMDGATFIRAVRADPALRTTPCVLLTGSDVLGEVVALDAGADAFVRKDAEGAEVVLARIRALLRGATATSSAPGSGEALAPKRVVAVGPESSALEALVDRLVQDGHDVVRTAGLSWDAVHHVILHLRSRGRSTCAGPSGPTRAPATSRSSSSASATIRRRSSRPSVRARTIPSRWRGGRRWPGHGWTRSSVAGSSRTRTGRARAMRAAPRSSRRSPTRSSRSIGRCACT